MNAGPGPGLGPGPGTRTTRRPEADGPPMVEAPCVCVSVSVCCIRNGRHVLAVTRSLARAAKRAHVNNKRAPVDVTAIARNRLITRSDFYYLYVVSAFE